MKRIIMAFSLLLAVGAAFLTRTNANTLADRFYEANPNNIAGTCRTIACELDGTQSCNIVTSGWSTYMSSGSEANCNTLKSLKRTP